MAKEEKNLPTKKDEKPSRVSRFLKGIANVPKRMWRSILNTIAELRKVTWPGRKDLINYTAIVLAFMVIMAIVVGLLDFGASNLISLIIRNRI